jgi:hypothetical protein
VRSLGVDLPVWIFVGAFESTLVTLDLYYRYSWQVTLFEMAFDTRPGQKVSLKATSALGPGTCVYNAKNH